MKTIALADLTHSERPAALRDFLFAIQRFLRRERLTDDFEEFLENRGWIVADDGELEISVDRLNRVMDKEQYHDDRHGGDRTSRMDRRDDR